MSYKPVLRLSEGGYWTATAPAEPTVVGTGLFEKDAYDDWREKLHEHNNAKRYAGCKHTFEIVDHGKWDEDLHVCTKCGYFWLEIMK